MIAKAFKIAGWIMVGLTIIGFASEAVDEIKEESSEETTALDRIALFSRKIVKKGFKKDRDAALYTKDKLEEYRKRDPEALKCALKWGFGAGALYYIGLYTYKYLKRRNENVQNFA